MVAMLPSSPPDPIFDDEPAPYDESALLTCSPLDARTRADALPLGTRFRLRPDITPVQWAFLQKNGFLVFARVAAIDEVRTILSEVDRIEARLLAEGTTKVNGVPVWFGTGEDGRPRLQRVGFTSTFSPWLEAFVTDPRFEPVRRLIGEHARIGFQEKDGVVFNRYQNIPGSTRPFLAWHTDALRDVFYNGKMPGPMLNVGLHFERIRAEDGGLRLLPGTHTQSVWSTLFRKVHFLTNNDDPNEVAVETWPGDLTVHDGRLWHRVKASPHTGARSIRHSMYVPYVVDRYRPKDERSGTPSYLRLFDLIMRIRAKQAHARWARDQKRIRG